jgi:photosystem II stability/assembly factor-like uncharacterized protein
MMTIDNATRRRRARLAALCMTLLAACGSSDDAPPPPPPPAVGSATIGAAGGFVDGPDGVRLALPPDATDNSITFRIARDDSGAPPVPAGVDLVSAIYAITPHGQEFGLPVAVRVPSIPARAAGRATFLMKAAPGGRWAVIGTDSAAATALQASIDSLSYFAVGACSNNLPPNSIGAQNCPTANVLRFELLTDAGTPFPVSQDTSTGAIQPVILITTPITLTGRITWTRAPFSFAREDRLETGSRFTGTAGGVVVERQAGIAWSAEAPNGLLTTQDVSRTFTITVTPAQVASALGVNGVVRPLWAQAVAGPWEYNALIPIRIRDVSAPPPPSAPTITQQPTNAGVVEGQPASFSVAASITPAETLTYQWSRRADSSAAFAPIAGATAATFTLSSTTLTDNGAEFQVLVCAATRCVTSSPVTLTVTAAPIAPSFTLQPASIAVVAGQTASFSVSAAGNPLPRVDWQSAPASDPNNFTPLSVAPNCVSTDPPASGTSTAATCTVGPLSVGDSGRRYRATATNSAATANSTVATLTVNPAPVAPTITQQPQAQTTTVGGSATFSVTATGTAPLTYTWQQGGINLPSVSGGFNAGTCSGTVTYSNGNATITLTGLSAGCNGVPVNVTVSNGVNPDAVSNSVTLTVNQAVTSGACLGGQSNWCYANPSPQAGGLIGLAYDVSTSTFTAVGPSGTTLRTSDGGATWQVAFEAGRTYFTDVASPASGLLVAAGLPPFGSGQNAGVFTSTDGGGTWTRRLDAGFPGQFAVTKLAFANASVGVAAGFRGLWRTVDGGVSWTAVPNVPGAEFVVSSLSGGVAWVDANVVLIYGSGGKILRSADQGASWADVSPAGFFEDWLDMAFNAAGVGIAVGPNGRVARSTNGGASWQELVTPLSESGTAVAFADANTVVAMGNIGQTMRSTDAGATWTTGFAFSASAFYRLRFESPTVGLAVSAVNGLTLRTTDAGETWTRIGGGTIDENVIGMAASPSGNVVLAGSLGRDLLRSADGGATWRRSGSFPVGAQFQKPAFATEQRAIAIRPSGQIVLSIDAGQTWSITDDRLGQVRLNDTTMASATVGLVVGNDGLILRSTDGGSNWAAVASGTSLQLKAVRCLTATVCVAGGGGLLRSTDSGATWAVLSSPGSGFGANVIAPLSDSVAVIASADGLWRTADAGLTWTRVYTAVQGTQLGVAFNAPGIGIATGYDGILRSTDQGVTWAPQAVPAPSYLNAVVWVSATTVLVGGDGGAILRNLQAGAP